MTTVRGKKRAGLSILAGAGLMVNAVLIGFFSQSAMAMTLDFNLSAPTSGTIVYSGPIGNGELFGSGIEVDNVVGLATPANDNVTSLCLSCVLNFTSGALTNSGGANSNNNGWWRFGPGGSITITGGVQLQGSSDIPLGSTLLSGSFDSAFVQDLGANFKVTFGSFSDIKHADLLAYYGLPEGNYQGALTLLFAAPNGGNGSAFTSTSVFSGNVVNTPSPVAPVPVPAAIWLFGSGVAALLAGRARRVIG